jgi:hypothetical protein
MLFSFLVLVEYFGVVALVFFFFSFEKELKVEWLRRERGTERTWCVCVCVRERECDYSILKFKFCFK